MAAMQAHASFPQHFTPVVPNARKVKAASASSSRASSTPPTGGLTPLPSEGEGHDEVTTCLLKAAVELLDGRVQGDLLWPVANKRHILSGDVSPKCVHHGAEWYACFSCSVMGSGCPGRLIVAGETGTSSALSSRRIVCIAQTARHRLS